MMGGCGIDLLQLCFVAGVLSSLRTAGEVPEGRRGSCHTDPFKHVSANPNTPSAPLGHLPRCAEGGQRTAQPSLGNNVPKTRVCLGRALVTAMLHAKR
jgi:hypothetical protein